ncbi:Odorant receptor 40, partial [Ephemera danica]
FNDTTMSATIIIVMLEKILQMAIMSYAGQKVIDSSLLLSHSVVSSSQIDTGVLSASRNTSALQVLHTRTSGPISKVSGLGFFTVSMEFFASVLSASTTYLLFLLQFKAVGGPTAYEVPKE